MMRAIASVIVVLSVMGLAFYGCNPNKVEQPPVPNGVSTVAPAGSAAPDASPQDVAPSADPLAAEAPQESVEQMLARWKEMAGKSTRENPLVVETVQLATEISQRDPIALLSLLDLVEDPQTTPFVKILATLSLPPAMNPSVAPRLIEMTKQEKDSTTRACGANLMRLVLTDEVTAALRQLKTDAEPRVALYAKLGLAQRDPEVRKEVYELWKQADLKPDQRGTIIDALGSSPAPEDLPIMLEVASSQTIEEGTKMLAVRALGSVAGKDQLELLKGLAEKDPSEKIREIAKASADQIEARADGKQQIKLNIQ